MTLPHPTEWIKDGVWIVIPVFTQHLFYPWCCVLQILFWILLPYHYFNRPFHPYFFIMLNLSHNNDFLFNIVKLLLSDFKKLKISALHILTGPLLLSKKTPWKWNKIEQFGGGQHKGEKVINLISKFACYLIPQQVSQVHSVLDSILATRCLMHSNECQMCDWCGELRAARSK